MHQHLVVSTVAGGSRLQTPLAPPRSARSRVRCAIAWACWRAAATLTLLAAATWTTQRPHGQVARMTGHAMRRLPPPPRGG